MWRKTTVLLMAAGLCLAAGATSNAAFTVKVNFQSNSQGDMSIPAGYLPDYGLPFGDRGNGFTYGWSRDISADARDRNSANSKGDQRYDTFIHFQKGAAAIWEIVIPNGTYNLHVVCGDPDNADQTNTLNYEGVVVSDPTPQSGNYDEFNVTVTVKDGRLTIQPALGVPNPGTNAKICFVDIVLAVVPTNAREPVPADKATDVPRDSVLAWTKGDFAQKHNLYVGTVFADVNNANVSNPLNVLASQGQTATTFTAATGLEYGKTYYWRIDEVNAPPTSTVFKGDVWSFTVEPYAYPIKGIKATASSSQSSAGPERTVDGSGLDSVDQHSTELKDMWLSGGVAPNWIQYEFDKVYKLTEMWVWNSNQLIEAFVGFGAKKVKIEYSPDGSTWTELASVPEFARAPGLATYVADTKVNFGGVVAKYVKLTIVSPWGLAPQTGLSEVRFFAVPTQARAPQPASAAASVAVDASLNWRPGREAASHKIYIGTDAKAVTDGTATAKTVTEHSFDPGALALGTTYYWRVDEVNSVTYPGDVWSFTTQAYRMVDDFESYTDKEGNRVFDVWPDGFDNPAKNGAVVGLTTAVNGTYCDTTNFYGGKQSMPLAYDNTTAPLSEATLTLAPAQDWTASGVKSLSLWFRGADKNGGQLYVKINNTKVAYNGSATDLTKAVWTRWNIDLSTVAGGVSKVTKLTVGIEGAGAKGTLNIDEFRLYPTLFVPITQPVITKVVRANGQAGTRTDASPITAFTGSTAPAPMPIYGLMDDAIVFSDRPYPWAQTPAGLVGAEYVLTFNTDKNAGETDVTYTVTFSRAATVFVTCDDRITNQQAAVDLVVAAFAKPGQFKNTGLKLYIAENATTNRPMSVFAADLPAGTYVFGAQDSGNNFYTIGVMRK